MACPVCGHANRASARFCAACGHNLAMPASPPAARGCSACGATCRADARYCPACGHALGADEPAADLPDFSAIGLDLPPADEHTVILGAAAPAQPSTAPPQAPRPTGGADADMTVILPPGWQAPAEAAAVRYPSQEITEIPHAGEPTPAAAMAAAAAAGAAAPPPPAAPPYSAHTSPPATSAPRKNLLIAAAAVVALLVGGGAWYWLRPAPESAAPTASAPPAVVPDTVLAERALEMADRALAGSASQLPPAESAPPEGGSPSSPTLASPSPMPVQDVATPPVVAVQTPSAAPRSARVVFRDACARCHERGEQGSPRVSAPDEWEGLLKRPRAALADRVLKGHGGAPAGAGADLSADEARQAVAHVADLVEQSSARAAAAERARKVETAPAKPATAPAQAAAAPAPPKSTDWQRSLRAELARCDELSFFARVACDEKARWTYCNNRWNSIPECTVRNQQHTQ